MMRENVAFDAPVLSPDGSGGHEREWVKRYSCRAKFIYSRGSEAVSAARLEGRAIYKIKIRQCDASRVIKTDWRMRDTRRSETYNIREVDAITDPKWVYLTVESGVAQ